MELRCCKKSKAILSGYTAKLTDASEEDWDTEYLAPILSIKIVDGINQAIEHRA